MNLNAFSGCTSLDILFDNSGDLPRFLYDGEFVFEITKLPEDSNQAGEAIQTDSNIVEIELIDYLGTRDTIVLPTISNLKCEGKDYEVNGYSFGTVFSNSNIKSIVISNSIHDIDQFAFRNCTLLQRVSISDNVSIIGPGAFENCVALEYVDLPSDITVIEHRVFSCCKNLKSITIPKNVKSIGEYAFQRTGLINIDIPNTVTYIGYAAFSHCAALEYVNFNSNEDSAISYSIGPHAFAGCGKLREICLRPGLSHVYAFAFAYCSSLLDFYTPYSDIVQNIHSMDGFPDYHELPPHIGKYAFFGCTSLHTVRIGEGILILGDNVFDDCLSLRDASLPQSLCILGSNIWLNCNSLCDIIIHSPNCVMSQNTWAKEEFIYESLTTNLRYFSHKNLCLYLEKAPESLIWTTTELDEFLDNSDDDLLLEAFQGKWNTLDGCFDDYETYALTDSSKNKVAGHLIADNVLYVSSKQ